MGFALTKGILTINGACTLLNDGATLAGGVSIGDGANAANDITFRILPESGLNINDVCTKECVKMKRIFLLAFLYFGLKG